LYIDLQPSDVARRPYSPSPPLPQLETSTKAKSIRFRTSVEPPNGTADSDFAPNNEQKLRYDHLEQPITVPQKEGLASHWSVVPSAVKTKLVDTNIPSQIVLANTNVPLPSEPCPGQTIPKIEPVPTMETQNDSSPWPDLDGQKKSIDAVEAAPKPNTPVQSQEVVDVEVQRASPFLELTKPLPSASPAQKITNAPIVEPNVHEIMSHVVTPVNKTKEQSLNVSIDTSIISNSRITAISAQN
jgi:hypothetical protein